MRDWRSEIGNPSASEKLEMIDALWESLEAAGFSLSDIQREELRRRLAQYKRKPQDIAAWEQVGSALLKHQ